MHISVAAEPIFYFFRFPLTNSLLATYLVMAFLIILALIATADIRVLPGKLQNFFELVLSRLLSFFKSVAGEKAEELFPILATFFIFILFANWAGLLPGFGSIGFYEEVGGKEILKPLFRGPTADLNTTLALAIFSVAATQYYSIKHLGLKGFSKRFFSLNPIYLFIGLLELISEFAKIISFSFRLFGNIFAGEVLLMVIAFLVPILAPIPFLGLEVFVGLIQALVFTMLTMVFMVAATTVHIERG